MRDQCYRRGWPHGEEQDGDNPCVCGEKAFHRGLHVCDDCGAKWAGGRAASPADPSPSSVEPEQEHEHFCATVEDHSKCRCLCGVTKPKGFGSWPDSLTESAERECMVDRASEWCILCPECHPGKVIADPCGKVHDCAECADQRMEQECRG